MWHSNTDPNSKAQLDIFKFLQVEWLPKIVK